MIGNLTKAFIFHSERVKHCVRVTSRCMQAAMTTSMWRLLKAVLWYLIVDKAKSLWCPFPTKSFFLSQSLLIWWMEHPNGVIISCLSRPSTNLGHLYWSGFENICFKCKTGKFSLIFLLNQTINHDKGGIAIQVVLVVRLHIGWERGRNWGCPLSNKVGTSTTNSLALESEHPDYNQSIKNM